MHTEQKVWSNWSYRQQNYLNCPTFTEYFVITWLFLARVLLWGPLFVGAPVRPNMLNVPKSASDVAAVRSCETVSVLSTWTASSTAYRKIYSSRTLHRHQSLSSRQGSTSNLDNGFHTFRTNDSYFFQGAGRLAREVHWSRPWLRGPAVEHRSLAGVLSLSCVRLVADG